jgi:ribose 5-phosphate isomerase A
MDKSIMKENAGKTAVEALVRDGMKLGLGTGSTAIIAVRRLGALMEQGTLRDIRAVTSSFQTELECEKWRIPVYSLNASCIGGALDLTIDGADQVDRRSFCVKGGGGALLLEKIVAYASQDYAIIVDETKTVENLGLSFPVALEVIPEARLSVCSALEALGAEALLREAVRKAGPIITDHGNFIIDIRFKAPIDPALFEEKLNHIPGIVENGFFTQKHPRVFIGKADGSVEERD